VIAIDKLKVGGATALGVVDALADSVAGRLAG